MAITLPLTLFGTGLLLYYLFGAATHALPIAIGFAAGFAASAVGLPTTTAVLIGIAVLFVAIAAGRFAILTARGPIGRLMLMGVFAIPAVIAGGALGGALANLAGFASVAIIAAPLAGLACGLIAANRLAMRTT